jgi:hypothetical protein
MSGVFDTDDKVFLPGTNGIEIGHFDEPLILLEKLSEGISIEVNQEE